MKFFKLAALQMMIASAQEIKPEEKIISRGGDIRLSCKVNTTENTIWINSYRGEAGLPSIPRAVAIGEKPMMDLGEVSYASGDYSLTIKNADDDKQGLWNCQQNTQVVASYNLVVDVPPEIEMVSASPVEVGEDSTLICQASGRPRPRIYWTRKGELGENNIDGAKTIELGDVDGVQRTQGTLIVKNVTKSMIAEISCNAESRGATVTEMTDVNVKCLPKTTNEAKTQARKSRKNGASRTCLSKNLMSLAIILLAYLSI
ncbi:unnamed protein product [Oikopleura dioica]|uniref:Ig-like domain-containing protein n=1 Tax=Oikopleura dioica TaxID=34765 RepID=E4YNX3_OIKDI|nr:unnamed protein product [Oikopleura dioica]